MSRDYSPNRKNLKRREKERATSTGERKEFIALDELRTRAVFTPSDQRKPLSTLSDVDFQQWFNAFSERIAASAGPKDTRIINDAVSAVASESLDDVTRLYFVNEVYRTTAYRQSGVEIFVKDKEVSA